MSTLAKQRDPAAVNKIVSLVESGLSSEQIAKVLIEEKEFEECGLSGPENEPIPDEIKIISQALAYRAPNMLDIPEITAVLSAAYSIELRGSESFRSGVTISVESVQSLFEDSSYQWVVVEAPNGRKVIEDGAIIGCCCFTTDGVSRKNGEVEGKLGSFRLLAVLPQFQRVCLGMRLLRYVETIMYKEGCCRAMICIPSPRESLFRWVERRGYDVVGERGYPAEALGQTLTREDVNLVLWVKVLESSDGTSATADTKEKPLLSIAGSLVASSSTGSGISSSVTTAATTTTTSGVIETAKLFLPPIWRQQGTAPPSPPSDSDDELMLDVADGKGDSEDRLSDVY